MHPTINHATAHKKSAVLLMRIARGESVGILFGTPVYQDAPHSKSAYIAIGRTERTILPTAHLSLIISVLVIPIWVSYAFLGYARNNSECFISPDFSPNRRQRYEKIRYTTRNTGKILCSQGDGPLVSNVLWMLTAKLT